VDGVFLIDHLEAINTHAPFSPRVALGWDRGRFTTFILERLSRPAQMPSVIGDSGWANTLEYSLAALMPAEWIRMWFQILSGQKRITLANKEELVLGENGLLDETTIRGIIKAMLGKNTSMNPHLGGFSSLAQAMRRTFGVEYAFATGKNQSWSLTSNSFKQPAPPSFALLNSSQGPRLFAIWRIDSEWVSVISPNGGNAKTAGMIRRDPDRRITDADRGQEQLDQARFRECLSAAWVPNA
jgi:hypothetical protein